MSNFLEDMLHMTEGEKLIAYWWLWVGITVLVIAVGRFMRRNTKGGQ